jgi:membrane protein DedA with SNARE-associated domain
MVAAGWRRQARGMLSMNSLLALDGWLALGMIFLLPALEAPAFIGLVLPGELVLVFGGVLAQQGRVPLAAALALGVTGPIVGDSVGHWLGRRFGRRLLEVGAGRLAGPARLARTKAVLQRRGGPALALGRMTAGVRVLLPGLAGAAGVRYRRFLAWTAPAAAVWAVAHLLLGYAAGEGWHRAHEVAGRTGLVLLVALAVAGALALAVAVVRRRHRTRTG